MGTILSTQGKKLSEKEVPTFKIVLVGEPGVGKSSIFLRYTKNQFDYSYQPSVSVTIGNVVKKVNIPYQGVVSVVIWDVPGREEMDLRKSYYKDVDAAIVVVDVSEGDTIGLAPTWKQDVLNHAQFTEKTPVNKNGAEQDNFITQTIPVLLLGNKADKVKPKDNADDEPANDVPCESLETLKELEETAIRHGFMGSVAVSAKEGDGSVHAAVQTLVRHLLQERLAKNSKQGTLHNLFNSRAKLRETKEDTDDKKPFLPFLKVSINELDDIFKTCDHRMQTVDECSKEYFKALHTFKRSCYVADFATCSGASLEECISGLREIIVDDNGKCGLKAVDDGGFVNLVIIDDMIEDIPGPVNKILRFFHTKGLFNPTGELLDLFWWLE